MSETYNPWDTSSGLALDGATETIVNAEFCYEASIAAGAVFLRLQFESDPEGKGQLFSVGSDWEPGDYGKVLVSTSASQRARNINKSTNYGILIDSVVQAGAAGELRGTPFEASTWIGARFTWGTKTITGRINPTTGQTKDATVFVVTEFHGYADVPDAQAQAEQAATEGAAAPATNGKPKSKPPTKAQKAAAALDAELVGKLEAIAVASDDHDAFMNAAWELVEDSPEGQNVVMAEGAGSLFQRARETTTVG